MHPILFRLPLPSFTLRYAWIPYIVAALAALFAASKLIGKEKDRAGALMGAGVAVVAIIARFTVMKGNDEAWNGGPIPIYSYGVMLGLSLVVGWYLTLGLAEREGLPKETMANNYVVTAIAAVAGSRILYILTNLNDFTMDPQTHEALPFAQAIAGLFAMRKGGLVAYGGFLGGLAGSYFFLRHHKIPLLPWADVAVPSLASGLMITRIGCYLFGCDFGQPLKASAPAFLKKLGTFPHWDKVKEGIEGAPAWADHVRNGRIPPTDATSLPVHPTQLYESLVGLGLLVLLLWARKRQSFRGQIFFLFAFAYGVCRYCLEILRDDAERGSIPPSLPEHVLLPLGLVILAVGWVIGFSHVIKNPTVMRVTQVLSFVPAVALYVVLQPDQGTFGNSVQYSTSQFIALTSGFAASVAFAVFYKAALAHPKHAMDLNLPPEFAPAGAAPLPVADEDDDEDDEEPVRRPPPKKLKAKGKGKGVKKAPPKTEEAEAPATEGEDTGSTTDEDAEPKKKPAPKKAADDEGEDASEPEKAT
jgi:phosphatidylglycerol:prolipoprotein diacylglycerol transferase